MSSITTSLARLMLHQKAHFMNEPPSALKQFREAYNNAQKEKTAWKKQYHSVKNPNKKLKPIDIIPQIPGMNFAADNSDGKRLFRDLFLKYLKAERPVTNQTGTVTVRLDPVLINLLRIEEVDEAVTVNFWMRVYWKDDFLIWDPEEYGGRTEIHVPQAMVWKPDVIIYNNLRLVDHVKDEMLYVKVDHTGNVAFLFPAIFEISCNLDIKYFPFDTQNCSLKFGSWSFHGFSVDLFNVRDNPPLGNYKENPEWHLKDAKEKVTMGMTTLLTMSVLLMMVADQLPRTSKVVPVLGLFYMYQLFLCAAATVTTVAIMNLEKEGHYGHKAPDWARDFFIEVLPVYLGMDWRPKDVRRKITNVHWINQGTSVLPEKALQKILDAEPNRATLMLHIEAEILRTLREIHARSIRIDDRHVTMNDWDRICDTLDRICMWIYLISFFIGSLIIFLAL